MNLYVIGITVMSTLLLCGCQKAAESKAGLISAFRAPSATEAFNLQSQCVRLGQKILTDNVIGSALTQEQTSHYNPDDNRCYVRLSVHTADLTTPRDNYTQDEFLFDGQTGETLAARYFKGTQGSAYVFDGSLKKMVKDSLLPSSDEVEDIMDKFTNTNRHP